MTAINMKVKEFNEKFMSNRQRKYVIHYQNEVNFLCTSNMKIVWTDNLLA